MPDVVVGQRVLPLALATRFSRFWPGSRLCQVGVQGRNHRQHDLGRVAEQGFIILELVQLVGERVDLLHLVVDHL